MVVLQKSENVQYSELAVAIAEEHGDRIVSTIDSIEPDDSVLYVDPPEEISESTLYKLYSRPSWKGISRTGVITGRTPDEAKALAYRDEDYGDEHGIVIRGRNKSATCDDEKAHLLARDEVNPGRMEELCSANLSSLSMRVKARDIHAYMSDGIICGVPENPEAFDFDGNQPGCIVDGERNCIYSKDLLSAERLAAPHMFISGCSSPLANNSSGLPVNLGLAFLSNAVTLIAPFRPISVHQYHVALNYSLIRAGYTAGERTSLLNQTSAQGGFGLCQHVLFGRPDAVAAGTVEQSFDVNYTIADDECRILLEDIDAHVIDFSIPRGLFADGQDCFFLRLTPANQYDNELFYTNIVDDDNVRVVVWSWGSIDADSLEFELDTSRVLDSYPHAPSLNDARTYVDIGLISGKAKRQFQQARDQLKGVAYQHRHEPFDTKAHASTSDKLRQVSDGLSRARKSLVESLADRPGNILQARYANNMYTSDLSVKEEKCPYCHRDLHLQTATDVYERVERSLGVCPYHIYVFDAPTTAGAPTYPTIHSEVSSFEYSGEYPFEVSFTNPQSRRLDATIVLRAMACNDEELITPAQRSVTIPAKETATVQFSLDANSFDPKLTAINRWLEAIAVTDDLQMYTGMRTFFFERTFDDADSL